MYYLIVVAVPDCIDDLPQKKACLHLPEVFLLCNMLIQLSPCHVLHHNVDLPRLLYNLVEVDDIGVLYPFENLYLVPDHVDGAIGLAMWRGRYSKVIILMATCCLLAMWMAFLTLDVVPAA